MIHSLQSKSIILNRSGWWEQSKDLPEEISDDGGASVVLGRIPRQLHVLSSYLFICSCIYHSQTYPKTNQIITSSGLRSLGLLGTSRTLTKPVASKLKVRALFKTMLRDFVKIFWAKWMIVRDMIHGWLMYLMRPPLMVNMMITFLPHKWVWSGTTLCRPPCPPSSLSAPGHNNG